MTWKVIQANAKKCVENIANWANKNNSTIIQSRNTMHWRPPIFKEEEMGSVGDLSKVCSQIVLKCLYLARVGRPDILWSVNKLARAITKWSRACDKRFSTFDLVHSSHMWIQTILSCGKHCQTMQIGSVSRLRFCRRSWGFKIYIRWTLVHFRKSDVRANKLDVQETDFSFT